MYFEHWNGIASLVCGNQAELVNKVWKQQLTFSLFTLKYLTDSLHQYILVSNSWCTFGFQNAFQFNNLLV